MTEMRQVLGVNISRRIGWQAAALAAVCMLFAGRAVAQRRTLYLLTATSCLNDTSATFPSRLYTVGGGQKLRLMRQVVPGSEGTSGVLDDTRGHIYVEFPSDLGVSDAPTVVSVIHKANPADSDMVPFNPKALLVWDRATATATVGRVGSYALFTLFPRSALDQGSVFFTQLVHGNTTRLAAVGGEAPPKGPRVTANDWGLYGHLTFSGSAGGPGVCFTPQAIVEDGNLVMRLGGETEVIDRAPPAVPSGRNMWILAANQEFLASIPLGNGSENLSAPTPATIYVHNRLANTWKGIKSAGNLPQCRIFGQWLATRVRDLVGPGPEGQYTDTNPGHKEEGDRWVKGLLPNVRSQYYLMDSDTRIPGMFTLDNLVDGRRITLGTHAEDSEILAVRKNGLVLYRVNDEIFSAKIEGDKLGPSKLVVKGEDVPEVHWAFWSKAQAEPAAKR